MIPIAASVTQQSHQPLILLLDECLASTTPELGPDSRVYPLITNKGYVWEDVLFLEPKNFSCSTAVYSLLSFKINYFFVCFKVSCRQQKYKLHISAKNAIVRDQAKSSSFQVCHWRRCKFTWFTFIYCFIHSSVLISFASSSGLPTLQACGMGPKRPGWWQESLSIWQDQLTVWWF